MVPLRRPPLRHDAAEEPHCGDADDGRDQATGAQRSGRKRQDPRHHPLHLIRKSGVEQPFDHQNEGKGSPKVGHCRRLAWVFGRSGKTPDRPLGQFVVAGADAVSVSRNGAGTEARGSASTGGSLAGAGRLGPFGDWK